MIAWEILITNSTIAPSSIAWDHLNNQGIGDGVQVVLGCPLEANALELLDADIPDTLLSSEITDTLLAGIDEPFLSASIIETLEADYEC